MTLTEVRTQNEKRAGLYKSRANFSANGNAQKEPHMTQRVQKTPSCSGITRYRYPRMATALNGPTKWLMTKILARQRVAVLFCNSTGTNQSTARIRRSVKTMGLPRVAPVALSNGNTGAGGVRCCGPMKRVLGLR